MAINYRHEWKYIINYGDLGILRQRLSAVMKTDPNAVCGKYGIRSLYFDNFNDDALFKKICGVDMREKFRIRLYNLDTSVIRLEKKSKRNGLCTKYAANLTAEETQKIVEGDIDWMLFSEHSLIKELYCKMRYQGMRPKTLVDYIREPFVFYPGGVRVTLDYDIRTGIYCTDILNPDSVTVPAGDSPILVEVKWDEFLPHIIRDAVSISNRCVSSFSKYAQCRIYG